MRRLVWLTLVAACAAPEADDVIPDDDVAASESLAATACATGPTAAVCSGNGDALAGLFRASRDGTSYSDVAQTFQVPRAGYAGRVKLKLRQLRAAVGTGQTIAVDVRPLTSGVIPTDPAAAIATGTLALTEVTRGRSEDEEVVLGPKNPAAPVQLQTGTTYAIVVTVSASAGTSANVGLASHQTASYASGEAFRRWAVGGATSTFVATGADLSFSLTLDDGVDIDECALNLDDCDANATCSNTPAPFSCACNAGYTGDGRTCTPQLVASGSYASRALADADGVRHYFRLDDAECCVLVDSMVRGSGWVFGGSAGAAKVGGGWSRGAGYQNGFRLDVPTTDLTTFSVSFWWRPTDMTIHASSDGAGIVWLSGDSSERIIGMNGLVTSNRLRWGSFPNASSMDGGFTLVQNNWHHIVLTQTAPDQAKLYVNGTLVATSGAYAFRILDRMYLNHYWEQTGGNTNNHYGRGDIDEYVVWNRVLTQAEITALRTAQNAGTPLFPQPTEPTYYASTAAAAADGLRGLFRMNEGSGTTLVDAMGNYTGSVIGGTATTGKVGGGWSRASTVNHGFQLNLGTTLTTFTAAFWWKPTDMTYYSSTDGAGIVWLTTNSSNNVIGMNGMVNANRLRWGGFPNLSSMDGNFTLTQNSWHHIAITVSGGTTSKLYVNGVERATSGSYSSAIGPTVYVANYFIPSGGNTNPHYGRGVVDEFAIWNRALTAAEIRSVVGKQGLGAGIVP